MKKMAEQQYIKHLYEVEGKSKAEIQRITGFDYRTVCKYAEKTDWNEEKKPSTEAENFPMLGSYIPMINEWLADDRKVPRKQRHTAKRIFGEHGCKGSCSSVRRYVKRKKLEMHQSIEGCLPLAQLKAYAQLDFGEAVYYDDEDNEKKCYALTLSFPYSNKGYTQVFPSQNQECLLEGMKRIFEYIGGVPQHIKFDNMSAAVAQVLEGTERTLTEGFLRFMLHYRFQADFCNPASGNEKGNAENKAGYSRRNAFVPVPGISSFDEFNKQLFDWCEKDAQRTHYKHKVTIQSLWEEEQPDLLTLPETPYKVFRYELLRVSKTGFAMFDTNSCGLSPELSNETVQAKIFYDKIEFYHNHVMIAIYRRSCGKNEELMDWTQYIRTLCKKPGAAEHTRFFGTMPQQWQHYISKTKGQERKDALQLLADMVSDGNADYCEDILTLMQQNGRSDAATLRQCYYSFLKEGQPPEPLELMTAVPILNYHPDLSVYDGLTGGEGNG